LREAKVAIGAKQTSGGYQEMSALVAKAGMAISESTP
jgi:hypothetical protein